MRLLLITLPLLLADRGAAFFATGPTCDRGESKVCMAAAEVDRATKAIPSSVDPL